MTIIDKRMKEHKTFPILFLPLARIVSSLDDLV